MNNVGQDHKDKPAIAVNVGSDSISAHVSEGALARLGDAVAWLSAKTFCEGQDYCGVGRERRHKDQVA